MTDLDIQELANLTAGDADVDNFERLFTKLKEMKGDWEMKKTFLVLFSINDLNVQLNFKISSLVNLIYIFVVQIKRLHYHMNKEKFMQRRSASFNF